MEYFMTEKQANNIRSNIIATTTVSTLQGSFVYLTRNKVRPQTFLLGVYVSIFNIGCIVYQIDLLPHKERSLSKFKHTLLHYKFTPLIK